MRGCKRCSEAPIGVAGVAEMTGKPLNTVESDARRGQDRVRAVGLPTPDFEVGKIKLWWPETIRKSGYGQPKN